jgi:hypothetical protein
MDKELGGRTYLEGRHGLQCKQHDNTWRKQTQTLHKPTAERTRRCHRQCAFVSMSILEKDANKYYKNSTILEHTCATPLYIP